MLWWSSANRDEEVFAEPFRFADGKVMVPEFADPVDPLKAIRVSVSPSIDTRTMASETVISAAAMSLLDVARWLRVLRM